MAKKRAPSINYPNVRTFVQSFVVGDKVFWNHYLPDVGLFLQVQRIVCYHFYYEILQTHFFHRFQISFNVFMDETGEGEERELERGRNVS